MLNPPTLTPYQIAVAELTYQMDYFTDEWGQEWYATFTEVHGQIVQITEWMPFEQAWVEYEAFQYPEVTHTPHTSRTSRIMRRLANLLGGD